jgi:hypothetical protein
VVIFKISASIEVDFHRSVLERPELMKCVFITLQTEEARETPPSEFQLQQQFYIKIGSKNMARKVHFTGLLTPAPEICFRPARVDEISLKIKLQHRTEQNS